MAYRTQRKKIALALAEKLNEIDGSYPYNSNSYTYKYQPSKSEYFSSYTFITKTADDVC